MPWSLSLLRMKGLRKFFFLSLALHLALLGVFSLEFPSKKAYPTVSVKLTRLETRPAVSKKPSSATASKAKSRPKKAAAKTKSRRKTATKPRTVRRKARLRKASRVARRKSHRKASRTSMKSRKALQRSRKVPEDAEKVLRERLAALKKEKLLREKLAALEKKVQEEEKGGGNPGPPGPGSEYGAILRSHLQSFWEVPLALEKCPGLSAVVRIKLSAQGDLLGYELVKPSGNALFDRAVVAAVKAAAPYPPPGSPVTVRAVFTPRGLTL